MISHLPARKQAMIHMIWSGILFGTLWAIIRHTSETVHPFVIVFYRTLFGLLAFSPVLWRVGIGFFKTERIGLHFVRALFAIGGTLGTFYAIANAPLADVVAISYAAPVFALIGAAIWLGERIKIRRILAILVGFGGAFLVVRPGFETISTGMLAAILGAVSIGASMLVIKSLSSTDDPQAIAAYSFLLILPVVFLVALSVWQWPNLEELGLLLVIGIMVRFAHTALGRAFALGEASAVLPLDFVRLMMATLFGVYLFGEPVDILTLAGALLILGSTVYTAHREAQLDKKATKLEP
jgi:drug/metabolite transporter (DMT)-like permease